MPDLSEKIRKLKGEGLSLPAIAAILSISHEAVRKRLKAIESEEQVSTGIEEQGLPGYSAAREIVSTRSKAHKSRVSRQRKQTVNRVSTSKAPSSIPYRKVSMPWKPLPSSLRRAEMKCLKRCV